MCIINYITILIYFKFKTGQETTANTLSFVFLELARNPLIFQKFDLLDIQ
jgi:hypothetical protein